MIPKVSKASLVLTRCARAEAADGETVASRSRATLATIHLENRRDGKPVMRPSMDPPYVRVITTLPATRLGQLCFALGADCLVSSSAPEGWPGDFPEGRDYTRGLPASNTWTSTRFAN